MNFSAFPWGSLASEINHNSLTPNFLEFLFHLLIRIFLGMSSSPPHSFLMSGGHFKEKEDEFLSTPMGQPGLRFPDGRLAHPKKRLIKGIWYGSDPVVISLQLTNFQSLIGLRINYIVFREDPKSHLPVSRTCSFFRYTITANGKNDISGKKIHFLKR